MGPILTRGAGAVLRGMGTDPDQKKKPLIGCGTVLVLLVLIFMIPVFILSLPGALLKSDKEPKEFDITKSKIYEQIKEVYLDYNAEIDRQVAEEVKSIKEEHSWTEKVENEETGEVTEEKKYPEVITTLNLQKPKLSYILAYLNTKHYPDGETEDIDEWSFQKKEVLDFLKSIGKLETEYEEKNGVYYYTATLIVSDEYEIAAAYFPEQDKSDQFLLSYESFESLEDAEADASYSNIDMDALTFHANGMEIPHYLQYDSKWGDHTYGSSNITHCGCGPTCMAMVLTYLTGEVITPEVTADWSTENHYYVAGAGTSWAFYSGIASYYDIRCVNLGHGSGTVQRVAEALSNGQPAIASMKPGTFTKGGHFIVLRGITKDGKILVNDPNDNFTTKNFYQREFDMSLIYNESKNFWIFKK